MSKRYYPKKKYARKKRYYPRKKKYVTSYKRRESLKRVLGSETKIYTDSFGAHSLLQLIDATESEDYNYHVFGKGLAKGDGKNERDGTKICWQRLEFRGIFRAGYRYATSTTFAAPHYIRLALIWVDADSADVVPTFYKFLQYKTAGPDAICSPFRRSYDSDVKFFVVKEKIFKFGRYDTQPVLDSSKTANSGMENGVKMFKISCKPKKKSIQNYSYAGTDPEKGYFCVVWGYDTLTGNPLEIEPQLSFGIISGYFTDM